VDGEHDSTKAGKRVRVAAFEPRSLVNGPGVRAVLWVQGCARRCPGCFNPAFLAHEGGRWVPVDEVIRWVLEAASPIGRSTLNPQPSTEFEGVTFSGGEPFEQALALAAVAGAAQARGLGVLVFTGHTERELRTGREPGWSALLAACDLLVAGPYVRGRPGRHPLLASANQELVLLTERYRGVERMPGRRRVELRIGEDGQTRVTGFPSADLLGAEARG
jgi:anaerobic ribonucleoside-triphosphate reductase activating protein